MKNFCLLILCGFVAGMLLVRIEPAYAIDPFKKEFEAKYVKKPPTTPEEESLAKAVAAAKCNVCHVGTNKKMRNEYGKALDVLLDKKTDAKDTAKIQSALDKVAEQKSDAKDPNSPTFGELFKQGKLPADAVPAPAAGATP